MLWLDSTPSARRIRAFNRGSERVTHLKELRRGKHYLRQRYRRGSPQMATVLVAISLIVLLAWLVGLVAWSIS
jgi:hypothetical protein